jgi:hypothetical protein
MYTRRIVEEGTLDEVSTAPHPTRRPAAPILGARTIASSS